MIRVVGPNPALDRIAIWPPVMLGAVNRAREVVVVAGGKGLNVARAVRALGSEVSAHGFLGGRVGRYIQALAEADGVIDRHTPIAGESRVCFILVEPERGRSTVLNEPGPSVAREETERFIDDLRRDCGVDDLVVLSGSLPDSLPVELAGEIVAVARSAGARTIVDSSGAALVAAVGARPWMVKCNRRELLALAAAGHDAPPGSVRNEPPRPLDALVAALARVTARGVEIVAVTLGAEGVLLADADGVLHVSVPEVAVVNATGSGDLLLAGLVVGLERGDPPRDAIVLGAACGTAGATHLAPSLPPGFDPMAWMPRMTLRALVTGRWTGTGG
jgi:1-phosphofructokinase family hexose kinase